MPTRGWKSPQIAELAGLGSANPAALIDARFSTTRGERAMRDPSRVRVTGPLERYAPGFAGELARVGYTPNSAALQLGLMAHASRWLVENELVPEQLSALEVERFLAARRAAGYTNHTSARGLEPLLGYLRGLGVVSPVEAPVLSAAELLLARYRDYLIVERGLAAGRAGLRGPGAAVRLLARG
jgi:hypothetical protein